MKRLMKWKGVLALLVAALALGMFLNAVDRVDQGRQQKGRQQLEDALHRTAAACYAAEGAYPPSLAYMQEHYGIVVDEENYMVFYRTDASNLMPEITVLELG